MSSQGTAQILVYAGALLVLAYPLGAWMTRVYGDFRAPGPLGAAERGFYWLVGTTWTRSRTGADTRSWCSCSAPSVRASCT